MSAPLLARRRAPIVLLVLAVVVALSGSLSAHAQTRTPSGWWYQGSRSELGSAQPSSTPPDAPADGLYLAAGPTGELTTAAVRFASSAAADTALVLRAADGGAFSASTPVIACPASGPWMPAQAGPWSERAIPACERVGGGVLGAPSADGTTMHWPLSGAFRTTAGDVDVVLVPRGPVPFRVPVDAPTVDALVASPASVDAADGASRQESFDSGAVTSSPPTSTTVVARIDTSASDAGASRAGKRIVVPTRQPEVVHGRDVPTIAIGIAAALAVMMMLLLGWQRSRERIRSRARELRGALRVERRLLRMLKPYWTTVAAGLFVSVLITCVGLAKPWPTKILVDDVLGTDRLGHLSPSSALVIAVVMTMALFLLSGGFGLLQTRILFGLSQRAIQDLRARLFEHLTRLSLRYHDERGAGDGIYRVSTDTYAVQSVLLDGLVPLVSAVITLVGTLVVMVRLDAYLAFLALLSAPAAGVVAGRFGSRIRDDSMAVHERESEVYAHAEQTLGSIRTVQAFGREGYEVERFTRRADASRGAMLRLVTKQTVFGLAIDFVLALGLALVTWVAARHALAGDLTPGEVLVLLAYAGSLYGPIAGLSTVFGELAAAAAGAQRVFDVLDEPVPTDAPGAVAPSPRAVGEVRFEGVTFGYLPGHPVVQQIDLEARPGELIALVGPTGAGKSTLVSLLLRLYDADEGSVTLDGHELRSLPQQWLRDQIAYVPQDPVLFPVSIRENIRYGRLNASDAEVEEAARLANVLDELLADPRGLDAPLGDRGVTLSGGQRQRVAIARAFLRGSPVVVLDEPTSALDASTEAMVMDAVERLVHDRTAIVVAHRLATVHRADQVLVLDGGHVVERGSHQQLLRAGGVYRDLHRARFGARRRTVVPLPEASAR